MTLFSNGIDKMKRCKKCLIPENYPDIKLNENGICNLCLNEKSEDDLAEKTRYKKEFEEYIEKIKGTGEYDCLLLYSGGKDSTYLLYILKEKYGLNILTVTVDIGVMKPVAKTNIKECIDHFNVDHITVTPENNFFKRLHRYFIQHPNQNTYCTSVCGICQKVTHDIGLNIAAEKKIPFVALALSPFEAVRYERPREILLKSEIPEELYQEPFTERDRSYFWDPKNVKAEEIPRFIIPFYAIDYPGVEKIIEKLVEIGLGTKRGFDPLRSNCYLCWLLMYLDIKKYNCNPYVYPLSRLIRQGKTKRRWSILLPLGTWLFKHGVIKRKEIKYALKYLDLKIEDCI